MSCRIPFTLLLVLIAATLIGTPLRGQQITSLFMADEVPSTWLQAGANMGTSPNRSPQACRIDACEALPDWEDATSATVRISNGCTGVLLNNTSYDRKPYILTAHHCGRPAVGQTVNWTFYFNDQVQDCSNPQPPTSSDTMQGAVVRAAKGGYNDYVLLELLEPIPAAYDVHFAGWSIVDQGSTSSKTRPSSGTVIGHPQGDLKKLTKDDNPINHYGATHWLGQFDHGTIEVGSSGSPLFNEHHQVVGLVRAALQMKSECSGPGGDDNEAVVLFPKLSYNWDAGAAGERLSEFLDPAGTGAKSLDALGSEESASSDLPSAMALPERSALTLPYPNPFNPQTSFTLAVPVSQEVSVEVYNLLGRRVAVLHEGTMQAHQARSFVWEASAHPSGVYLIRVVGEQFVETRRVTLIK